MASRSSTTQEGLGHTQLLVITNKILGLRKQYKSLFRILLQSYGPLRGLEEIDLTNKSLLHNLEIMQKSKMVNRIKEDPSKPRITASQVFRMMKSRVECKKKN